tara:strand:- start:278 stop:511 length:234 start_codon:yes stop_codon:yes gene_type:complete
LIADGITSGVPYVSDAANVPNTHFNCDGIVSGTPFVSDMFLNGSGRRGVHVSNSSVNIVTVTATPNSVIVQKSNEVA